MTAADHSNFQNRPASPLVEPGSDLRPGDMDLSDPKTFLEGVPHDYFRVLREQAPVQWQEECKLPVFLPGPGYWALTRYDDVVFVSKNPTSSLPQRELPRSTSSIPANAPWLKNS